MTDTANSPVLAQLRQGLLETTEPRVQQAVAEIVRRDQVALAECFYRNMLADPEAAAFLSVQAVSARLKPGMARWLEQLLCHENAAQLEAVLAMQHHVGEVHARAEIPVHLVARGMRLLKREISNRLLVTELSRDDLISAVLRVDRLIDIAFEEMSAAFVYSHEKGVRTDEAYRMIATGNNLSVDRERQTSALLDWENRLFRALATDGSLDQIATLRNSPFGLWLHHKAALIFDDTRELSLIDEGMRRIDDSLLPQLHGVSRPSMSSDEMRQQVRTIMTEIEQIKYLLANMFDRLSDLEVGRDVLTQLFNRRFMPTILKQEIELGRRKGVPFCILMVDIDHFKQVNDQYGHDAGDRVLQHVAGLLVNQVRASDFVFRYGGEEFLIVLAELDVEQATHVAEKIRRRLESARIAIAGEQQISVTLSLGVAAFDGHPDYQKLVDRADKALYVAKNGGRNRWVTSE
ncbi:MAG: GGDEF domain-containing protein [Dechloromonas sp.]|nr:GGDEF domain-containing protein [Dechloromonas sp.]